MEPSVVVLTGGGSNIPDLVDAVRAAFGPEVKPGREPHLNVARGLAGYGRLQSRAREFRWRSLELFSAEPTSAVIRSAYSGFVRQTLKFYGEHITDGIWRSMADLWRADELHLNERGEFREFALGLFRDWLDSSGQGSFDDVVSSFSETITAAAAPGIAELAQEFGIPADGFRLDVSVSPLEPFENHSIVSNADQISWKAQGLFFRGVDLFPPAMRKALGGKFLELCLEADKQMRKGLMTAIAALISDSGKTPETYRLILDDCVERAAAAALDRSLHLIEGLLLGPESPDVLLSAEPRGAVGEAGPRRARSRPFPAP